MALLAVIFIEFRLVTVALATVVLDVTFDVVLITAPAVKDYAVTFVAETPGINVRL